MKEILCNKCKKPMLCLGNVSGYVYMTHPPQWDDTYVCDDCKEKKHIRHHEGVPPDYRYLGDYQEQK